jgi:hypothetical protein
LKKPRRPIVAVTRPLASRPEDARQGGRLMIVHEPDAPGQARVIGSLSGDGIRILIDAVDGGVSVLDLTEVDQLDDAAVCVLVGLSLGRCTLMNCPRWLELWLVRVGND